MSAWAFCIAYNEELLIPYWVRHYRTFCDNVVVFVDQDTTDNTANVAVANGAEVREFSGYGFDEADRIVFANTHYQEAIADWVVWADADEMLYHPHIVQRLEHLLKEGINLPQIDCYTMSSNGLPEHPGQIYDDPDFRRGVFAGENAKVVIFNPNTLPLRWYPGKHRVDVIGYPSRDEDQENRFKLLHYRWLGEDFLRSRDQRNYARLSENSKQHNWCAHWYPEFTGPYDAAWVGPGPKDAVLLF